MTYILSIETATTVCSVALHKNGELLGHLELFVEKSHSSLLTVLINELVNHCGVSLNEINAIAISEGPGSYTGLRIGTSTAKGLCVSLEIPLVGVGTLEAMILSMQTLTIVDNSVMLCPMLDARRMEVYCLLTNGAGEIIDPVEAKVVDENSFANILETGKVVFFGNGAMKCKEVINHPNAFFIGGVTPNAKNIGDIAYHKFLDNDFLDLAYYEPFYLKDFRPTQPKVK